MDANIGLLLHEWAKRDPQRVCIIDAGHDEVSLSYRELDRRASLVAADLAARGLGPSDRVALFTGNGTEFIAAWFGAIYAGCATLPLPASSTPREIAFRLRHAGCAALITDAKQVNVARESLARTDVEIALLRAEALFEEGTNEIKPRTVPADAYAMLLYTSGTTGAAKCACITHGSLGAHTRALAEHTLGLTETDRILGTLPLTHSYGLRTTLLVPFHLGASTVFVPRFSSRRTLELCNSHGVTWLPGVPTMYKAWVDEPDAPRPPRLRWCMSAGAPLPEDLRLRAEARLGAPVRQAYGLTEANLTAINAPPDRAVPGSSGKPVKGVEIRIAGPADDERPLGAHGEVLVRGPNLMAGYLEDPLATSHVMRGGWLHTGDIGFLDDQGRLSLVDRSKDLILRGGRSIYPSEIETALLDHPAVRDVAVVGEPDDYYGEEIVAVVVAEEDATVGDLDVWVRERLAPFKAPRRYAFVDSLPRGRTGKTLKRRLRDQITAGKLLAVKPEPAG